jgi:mRNA interferase MazF
VTGPVFRRGDVWWVSFDPALGGEIRKTRPAVIVSNDDANERQNRAQVVPLTSSATRLRSWEARIVLGGRENKALADQIRTVTKKRFRERMARVSDAEMSAIERAIKIQLGMT